MEGVQQRAAIYVRDSRAISYPQVRTEAGFFMADEPYILIPKLQPVEIAQAVSKALNASGRDIPTPGRNEWAERSANRFLAAGVKSEAAFMRRAQLVTVERHGDVFDIVPYENGGATGIRRGFSELRDRALRLTNPMDHIALGSACLNVLQQCR